MTRYCVDLMAEEKRQGHEVSLLWPGVLTSFDENCAIKARRPFVMPDGTRLGSYELKNPLPVPLINGIREANLFTQKKDKEAFLSFFRELSPDVFHVHTLQGLPLEALEACAELGVRTVFTSHDFFGICPIISLEKSGRPCTNGHDCADCPSCNREALSRFKLRVIQSNIYRATKELSVIKSLRRRNNRKVFEAEPETGEVEKRTTAPDASAADYVRLRDYYARFFVVFDLVLFNSNLTHEVFERYVSPRRSFVVNVTHSAIRDMKSLHVAHETLRIGYLGPRVDHKGYFVLRSALDEIEETHPGTFSLSVFFREGEGERPYLISHDPYDYDDLPRIMDGLDVVIVPSTRYETFGFTALEAMSFGVPVIVSSSAGAKDIVEDGVTGIVCDASAESLARSIGRLISNPDRIEEMSKEICLGFTIPTMADHTKTIIGRYADLLRYEERSAAC